MQLGARTRADITLFLVAIIWGSSFVAGRIVAQSTGSFLYNGLRFFVAAVFLLILMGGKVRVARNEVLLIVLAALVLFGASTFQQAGLTWTTAANAGFFTGLYVIIVPLLVWLIFRQKIPAGIWAAAVMAILGTLLLSAGKLAVKIAPGDGLELIGALFWALHLIIIGIAARRTNPLTLTFGQLVIAGSLHLVFSAIFEDSGLGEIATSAWAIIYTGIFSIGLGYSLQAYGQRHAPPADAAIILSLESVFAAILGVLLIKEKLNPAQWLGCGLIFGAILITQIQGKRPVDLMKQEALDPRQDGSF